MSGRLPHLLLVSLMPLAGCAAGNFVPINPSPGLTGNWQIQSGTAITSGPTSPVFITGALQQQGSQVTGVFTVDSFCTTQPTFNFTGTVDASGNLALTATPFSVVAVKLAIPTNPTTVANGTLGAFGEICALAWEGPAVGVRIASVTGTFTGPVTANATTPPAPISSGSVSLSLTQASTANASGQFPVAGELTFTGGGCTSNTAVTGTISGEGIVLGSSAGGSSVSFAGATDPATSAIAGSAIQFPAVPCSGGSSTPSSYAGTLTRQ